MPLLEPPPDFSSEFLRERPDHIGAGRRGEASALEYLVQKGYTLRDRNYRFGRGELDLVMESPEGDLVFIEVKSSRGAHAGDPLAWVHGRKQRQIQRIAQGYCIVKGIGERSMRFDVVSVQWDPKTPDDVSIRHIPHAFIPEGRWYYRG
jgi:putative endonuclease